MAVKTYEANGVKLSRKTFYSGDILTITYNGILFQEGAENICLHYGYGSDWADSTYIQMNKTDDGFSAEIEVADRKSLELCFKDPADNWDNNSGQNYIYNISAKRKTDSEKSEDAKSVDVDELKAAKDRVSKKKDKKVNGNKSEISHKPERKARAKALKAEA